ncbi:MAG TPA: 16S rRNA (guanine(966)-N(2))-methyltransferase RsmD [Caulobacteraceae bacterium]|nr:16S rRNA (guanine(966)-N(2))-methyltransferase RsmD [Caulobacteraceae bacterium]
MRIVAGTFRGRPLVAPKGHLTRPTADRARQAIFNVLEHAAWSPGLDGVRVLDLFAGSGAMGLEAISRGADACLFVERAEPAVAAIRANLAALGLEERGRVVRRDAAALTPRATADGAPYDLALLDPPYGKALGEAALVRLAQGGWLAAEALAVLERGADDPAVVPEGFELVDERRWGAARVSFLRAA